MADAKISALPASTTPLAGTEVLPIVQSNVTKKVSTDDLTVKNLRSNATTGILQMAGVTASQTRVATVPDANFTVARIDAAQSFTGDQTLATGNLVIGTAGKGIDFTQDPNPAGMTSELLDDYEEGTWTPSVGGDATYSVQSGTYIKVGDLVHIEGKIVIGVLGTGSATTVSGLPFTVLFTALGITGKGNVGYFANIATSLASITLDAVNNSDTFVFNGTTGAVTTATNTPNIFADAGRVDFAMTYRSN